MGHAMEWLGLHFITELPETGQVILNCTHDPFLVLLAYLVACVGSFATLDMAERVAHAEKSASKTRWRWVGSGCLAGGDLGHAFCRDAGIPGAYRPLLPTTCHVVLANHRAARRVDGNAYPQPP